MSSPQREQSPITYEKLLVGLIIIEPTLISHNEGPRCYLQQALTGYKNASYMFWSEEEAQNAAADASRKQTQGATLEANSRRGEREKCCFSDSSTMRWRTHATIVPQHTAGSRFHPE